LKHRLRKLLSFFPGAFARKCSWDPDDPSGFFAMGPETAGGPFQAMPKQDHARGPDSAPITLVEYGDYQCTQCGEAYLEIEKLREVLGDRLRFVFRQYPYAKLHPQAELAAEAAEAAGAQGRFWEMHDLLFRRQDALRKKHLLRYAETLGLNRGRFCWELKNRVYRDRVRRDFRSGVINGVYSTPTVFINGVRHAGALTTEALLDAVNGVGDPRKSPGVELVL
jgi:protein-disulfide isomerase